MKTHELQVGRLEQTPTRSGILQVSAINQVHLKVTIYLDFNTEPIA